MDDTFGARLKRARLEAGLTQRQLARNLSTAGHISRLEAGRRRPSAETLDELAARLGVDAAILAAHPSAVGRARQEPRLVQADRALACGDYALADRLATHVITSLTNAERRVDALCLRAFARSAMRRPRAALDDLMAAHGIAQRRGDTRRCAEIAIECARLRRPLEPDTAA